MIRNVGCSNKLTSINCWSWQQKGPLAKGTSLKGAREMLESNTQRGPVKQPCQWTGMPTWLVFLSLFMSWQHSLRSVFTSRNKTPQRKAPYGSLPIPELQDRCFLPAHQPIWNIASLWKKMLKSQFWFECSNSVPTFTTRMQKDCWTVISFFCF